ncbi:hypothetical protein Avbf_08368 [Armadillidium vulgare]|nr:hypothetical protein Avbf_08368 [Armadillidium vulgare]
MNNKITLRLNLALHLHIFEEIESFLDYHIYSDKVLFLSVELFYIPTFELGLIPATLFLDLPFKELYFEALSTVLILEAA